MSTRKGWWRRMDQQRKKYREPKDTLWGKCLTTFIAIVFAMSTLTIIPLAGALDNPANEQADAAAAVAAKEAANEAEGKTGTTLTEETPKPIENLINEDKKGETLDTVENVLGVQSTDEEDATEAVPAEVQAFLDAVKKLPAADTVTAENAEGVGEQVNAVLDMWDAMSVENGEREDVNAALEEAYAVLEAVLAVENVEEAEVYYTEPLDGYDAASTFYSNGSPECYLYLNTHPNNPKESWTNPAEYLTVWVGESGSTQRLYTHSHSCKYGHIVHEETPEWIAVEPNKSAYFKDSNPNTVKDMTWSLKGYVEEDYSDAGYGGYPALNIGFTGKTPGNTTLKFSTWQEYYYNFYNYYGYTCPYCGAGLGQRVSFSGWVEDKETLNITVNARYELNYNSNGGSIVFPTVEDKADTSATLSVTGNVPTREGYTFAGWYEDQECTNPAKTSYTLNWSEGYGSTANPVSKTLYAKWTPNKTYTVTYTDGVAGATVFPDQGYEGLKEGDNTPAFVGTPSREGYTFQGWSPAVNPVVSADDADENGEIVYTATWKKNLKDLTVSKSPSEEYPIVGKEFSYTITVTNPNSDEIKVKIIDVLNEKLDFVAAGDGGTYDSATRTVTWTNVTVPASGSKNVTVYVKANAAGEIYNEAQIECDINTTSGNTTVTAKNPDPVSTTYTIIHEYYTNGERDGFTKQENISGKNVGDVVKVDDIDKVLKYTKNGVENTYAYTQANKGTANNSPNGYTIGDVITELTLGKDGNIIVLRYDRNVTPPVTPSLSSLQKQRLTEAPDGVTVPEGINYDNTVVFVGDNASNVTLLYKLTVTGTEGAAYKVTDENATWVGGDPLVGTIADGKTEAVIYVTKTFTKGDVANGKLVNNATLESNDNNTTGPDNGEASGEAGAKKQYNVIINFTTDGGAVLQDPSKTTVDEGADFNYSMGQTAARMVRAASATGSDVNAVVIPQRLGANNEYVLDEVASAEGLDKLAHAQNITADIVADIVYSLDTKGTINPDGTDTFDGTPDKYQVKVTYKVVNGAWNDESIDNVVTYLEKYKDGIMAADGIATLGDTIPTVGDKPATGYEAGSWNETPASDTTISSDAEYAYTYKLITYTITYDLDGGTVDGTNPVIYTVESDDITLTNPTREGYTFAGWTGTGLTGATNPVTIAKGSTGNREYTATWNANGDTAYTVDHYQQNLDGTYSLVETENLTGATDSMVTATVKAYEGFTHNPAVEGTLLSATVAGNGSTVLSVYYDRNTYTVSYDLNGGTVGEDVQTQFEGIRHGDTTPTIDDPARTGYIFAGWTPEVTDTVTGDVTYVAQWTPVTFDIDVQVVNGTSDAATAGTTVNYGGDVTYTFTPNDGYVLDSVMVDGNPAALSADGTFTFNAVIRGHTIVVTYVPAPVIPPTPTDPTPTPTPTPGPTPAVTTPADAAAPAAAAAAAAAVEAIADDGNPLAAITTPEAIDDDANALAAFEEIHCWTHWLMLFGALVTIVYGLGVLYARRHSARDMDDFEGDIMDGSRRYSARQASDPAANGAFQAM